MLIDRDEPGAQLYVGQKKLVFEQRYVGISTAGSDTSLELAQWLFVIVSSDLFAYYTSMIRSHRLRRVRTIDVDRFPFIALEKLSEDERQQIEFVGADLAERVVGSDERLNELVNQVYGLNYADTALMRETLARRGIHRRDIRPSPGRMVEIDAFATMLRERLRPFFLLLDKSVWVTWIQSHIPANWLVWEIADHQDSQRTDVTPMLAEAVAADELMSHVYLVIGPGLLYLAVRNDRRHLDRASAIARALELLRQHGGLFRRGET